MVFRSSLVMALIASLCACGLFDSGTVWQSGRFEIYWIDTHANNTLGYRYDESTSLGILDGCMLAAGANEEYVVVKRKALKQPEGISYFTLKKSEFRPEGTLQEGLVGPLSEAEFLRLAERTSFPELQKIFPEATCEP